MSKNTNLRKITNHLTADNNVLSSNVSQTITGSLTVTGNLTAQQFIVSSSVTYLTESFASGSHKFGDSSDDIHTFTGSLVVSGSANPLRVGSNLLFVSSSGNVGIGTSTPDRPLDLYSSTVLGIARIRGNNSNGVALTIQNDENAQGISIYAAGTSGFGLNGWAGNTALESETGFVYSAFNGNHIFQNGNRAERMRITSDGYLRLAGRGVQFNGDTSDANSLDDYEEGTWTPVIRGANTAGTYQLSSASHYIKIGNQVTATSRITMAGTITGGGAGYLQITGLPFSKGNNVYAVGSCDVIGLDTTGNYLTVQFVSLSSTNVLFISETNDNASAVDLPISGLSANDAIGISITYFV
jgi:hypothetical protein